MNILKDTQDILEISAINEIENLVIEPITQIEELYIEEFSPIEELHIEQLQVKEFDEQEIFDYSSANVIEQTKTIDEIEELAKSIVEEIATKQKYNITKQELKQDEKQTVRRQKAIIPLFGQKATIESIIVKMEDGQLLYKAQMSDGDDVKIYPSRLGEQSVFLRDKQNREECRKILINYSTTEYKIFDKKVVNKIDPLICELLIECSKIYEYNAQELIYNYAMSFIYNDVENTVPSIVYNCINIDNSELSKKEKTIFNKICKNARRNNNIEVIGTISRFDKIKYVFKRLFTANNVKLISKAM